jgi:hypothetical protein
MRLSIILWLRDSSKGIKYGSSFGDINHGMTLPGWDSLDTVKKVASAVQFTTLIFWGLLELF